MKAIMKLLLLLVVMQMTAYQLNAQIITTIAGNGVADHTGDGGSAAFATVNGVDGAALDSSGNLFFTETLNNDIRKINSAGIITTIAGGIDVGYSGDGGPATAALLNYPTRITLDSLGNIFFTDGYNNCVRKISTTGIITTVAGNGIAGFSGDGGPATAAELNHPSGIGFDRNGNMYIADFENFRIRKVNPSGNISTIAGTGVSGYGGDGGLAVDAVIALPTGLVIDTTGNIYFSDFPHSRVRKITPSGYIYTAVGTGVTGYSGDGGPATAAQIGQAGCLAVDKHGNFYLSDMTDNVVRKVNSAGVITTIAGTGVLGFSGDGGLATMAEISGGGGIAVDTGGSFYICDYSNNRVREVTYCTLPVLPTIIGIDTLCAATSATLFDSLGGGVWTSNNDSIASINLFGEVSAISQGSAIVTYSVSNGCGTVSATHSLVVKPLPEAGIIFGIDSLCISDTAMFTDSLSGGMWVSSDTAIVTVSSIGRVTGLVNGSAIIYYVSVNACGADTASRMVYVKLAGACAENTEIVAQQNQTISVVPNPNNGSFNLHIESGQHSMVYITIKSALGEMVYEKCSATSDNYIKIDVKAGIYFLSVTTNSGVLTKRILIK